MAFFQVSIQPKEHQLEYIKFLKSKLPVSILDIKSKLQNGDVLLEYAVYDRDECNAFKKDVNYLIDIGGNIIIKDGKPSDNQYVIDIKDLENILIKVQNEYQEIEDYSFRENI